MKTKNNDSSDPSEEENSRYHVPVLLNESIEGLNIIPSGSYVDCTFGGGGHSKEILRHLDNSGRLFAFDQDVESMQNIPDDERITFIPHNFRHLQRFLKLHKIKKVNGILADLGVSSHQFDEPARGFSTRFDGDLDMRMDKRQPLTAYEVVSGYPESELHKIFELYGEVTNSKTLARKLVQTRDTVSLKTVNNFKTALSSVVKGNPNKYFAQVFQALRIEVNDELGALKELLTQIPALLVQGGRVAVISFHSLEDRLIKNFFKKGSFNDEPDANPFTSKKESNVFMPITKKPIIAGEKELKQNSRARSAKLRIAEKVTD